MKITPSVSAQMIALNGAIFNVLLSILALTVLPTGAVSKDSKPAPPASPPVVPIQESTRLVPSVLPQSIDLEDYVAIPLIWMQSYKYYYIETYISGKSVNFVIDTGATSTCISLAIANDLKLELTDAGMNNQGITEKVQTWNTVIKNASFGNVYRPETPVVAFDMKKLTAFFKEKDGIQIEGIIGGNFLKPYNAIIDYRNNLLYLHDPWSAERCRLQGKWKASAVVLAGVQTKDENYTGKIKLEIEDRSISLSLFDAHYDADLYIDTQKNPKYLGLMKLSLNGKKQDISVICLYVLRKDTLQVLIPIKKKFILSTMPTFMESTEENGAALITFKRVVVAPPPRPRGG